MDIAAELEQGAQHHREGRVDLAARCYKRVLEQDPDNSDALHLMSALACLGGQLEVACLLARQAIAGAPQWFAPYVNLGNAEQARGNMAQAEQAFRIAIQLNPQCAEAHCNLANLLNSQGLHDEAVLMAARSVALDASMAEGHNNFGNALLALGSPDEAATCYRRALNFKPGFAEAWYNLGGAQTAMGDDAAAAESFRQALNIDDRADWHFKLANALACLRRYGEAEVEYGTALASEPDNESYLINLANVLAWQGKLDEAVSLLNDAVERRPDAADLHWTLALVLLRRGDMAEAWPHYEQRWRMASFGPYVRPFGKPQWDGGPLEGRTLLVHAEQGFGDAIQFSRFVPLVAAKGGRVVLECRKGLARLMSALSPDVLAVERFADIPPFDLTVPLMSLGHRLGITPETLPTAPYLSAPAGAADFADVAARSGRKVGLVWSGSPTRARNALRSLAPRDLEPLLDLPGFSFFGLQVGADEHPTAASYTDLTSRLRDFADTAAAIQALDLVVTVDTAVAHLAGALGKPVWIMLSTPCDGYFWMSDRADTPWYPSARLYRQRVEGEWGDVVADIRRDLGKTG